MWYMNGIRVTSPRHHCVHEVDGHCIEVDNRSMGPVLPQEETGVPEENLWGLVQSNWISFLSNVTKVTSVRLQHGAGIEPKSQ